MPFFGRFQMDVGGALLLAFLQDVVHDQRHVGGERLIEQEIFLLPRNIDWDEILVAAAFGCFNAGLEARNRLEEGRGQHHNRPKILARADFEPIPYKEIARIECDVF
jgi:hypothetical protein